MNTHALMMVNVGPCLLFVTGKISAVMDQMKQIAKVIDLYLFCKFFIKYLNITPKT